MGDNLYSFLELIGEEVNYLISECGLWIASLRNQHLTLHTLRLRLG
jgi:hypothetical protein